MTSLSACLSNSNLWDFILLLISSLFQPRVNVLMLLWRWTRTSFGGRLCVDRRHPPPSIRSSPLGDRMSGVGAPAPLSLRSCRSTWHTLQDMVSPVPRRYSWPRSSVRRRNGSCFPKEDHMLFSILRQKKNRPLCNPLLDLGPRVVGLSFPRRAGPLCCLAQPVSQPSREPHSSAPWASWGRTLNQI